MTSFIIVSKDKNKRDEYLKEFYKKHTIDVFDQTILTLDNSVKQNSASIGIEDIKQMQKKLFLKPLKGETKAVILEDAELLTIEAQNALLKVLEEPPQHTLIVLSTNTKETLLPTIISRCQLIQLEEEELILSEKEKTELQTFLEDLPKWGIGERLKKAEQLAKDKNKAIEWIEKLILVTREKMLTSEDSIFYANIIRHFQSLHTLLKTTNTNPRFAIENTLLQLT
jgi:DNA polymerase III delta prime subunit